jgi:hypothetical protein
MSLLHLERDGNQEPKPNLEYQRMASSTYDELPLSSFTLPKNHYSHHQRIGEADFNHNIPLVTNKNVIPHRV